MIDHITHIEDLAITRNIQLGIDIFQELEDNIFRGKCSDIIISEKWDGSPSIILGKNRHGDFFVSTKSFFNKAPIMNFSLSDIQANHKDVLLQHKLTKVFDVFCGYEYENGTLYQGDLLFTTNSINTSHNDGDVAHLDFQPNLITYELKENHPTEWDKIINSDVGIAFHTQYKIMPDSTLMTRPLQKHIKIPEPKHAYVISCVVDRHLSSVGYDKDVSVGKLKHICYYYYNIRKLAIGNIDNYDEIKLLLLSFAAKTPQKLDIEDFNLFILKTFEKKMKSYKTNKGRMNCFSKYSRIIYNIALNETDLLYIISIHQLFRELKQFYMNIFENNIYTKFNYYKDDNITLTKQEGYVITFDNITTKFIDRFEFSEMNRMRVQ